MAETANVEYVEESVVYRTTSEASIGVPVTISEVALGNIPIGTEIEGKTNSDWVLLDYVNVVGHIFYKEKRSFYDIEELWSDAARTNIPA